MRENQVLPRFSRSSGAKPGPYLGGSAEGDTPQATPPRRGEGDAERSGACAEFVRSNCGAGATSEPTHKTAQR